MVYYDSGHRILPLTACRFMLTSAVTHKEPHIRWYQPEEGFLSNLCQKSVFCLHFFTCMFKKPLLRIVILSATYSKGYRRQLISRSANNTLTGGTPARELKSSDLSTTYRTRTFLLLQRLCHLVSLREDWVSLLWIIYPQVYIWQVYRAASPT